jgi:predicted nucleic acid-binding protein
LRIVVDASVVAKWFVAEPNSDSAQRVFESNHVLVVPGHALGEVGEVLVRQYRRGAITAVQLALAEAALPTSLASIRLDLLFARSLEIALHVSASFYDILYIAAAEYEDTFLISADDRLIRAVNGSQWQRRVVSLPDAVPRL